VPEQEQDLDSDEDDEFQQTLRSVIEASKRDFQKST